MTCSGILGKASTNPGWCISGPFGYASACLDVPVWGGWNEWDGGWRNGWYGGDGDWEGGDD